MLLFSRSALLFVCAVALFSSVSAIDFDRSLASSTCTQQTVGNPTCIRSLDLDENIAPRYTQILCSEDRTRVGQVSYSDESCSTITDMTVINSGICMICPPSTTVLDDYLPGSGLTPYVMTYENDGCTGNAVRHYFESSSTCAYVDGSAPTDLQQTYSCDGLYGTLKTYSGSTNGTCSGQPLSVDTRKSRVCEGTQMFRCPVMETLLGIGTTTGAATPSSTINTCGIIAVIAAAALLA